MPQHLSAYINVYKIATNWPLYYKRYFFFFTLIYVKSKDQNVLRIKGKHSKAEPTGESILGQVWGQKNPKIV